jgi:ABC-2 type transport system permease protein
MTYLTGRHLLAMWRQPAYVLMTVVQPIVWLLLYGALFRKVVEIPGFGGGSYLQFLTPGVVVMSALFSSGWSGMGYVEFINRGVMDRFLTSPVSRIALMASTVLQSAVVIVIQSVIIVGIALWAGARFPNGVVGITVLIGLAALLGAIFSAFSNGVALLARHEQTVIGFNTFLTLPLVFLSAAFMAKTLMPTWMQHVADYNPVNWAVEAGRRAVMGSDWSYVGSHAVFLAAVAVLFAFFATQSFRTYQRSV